LVLATPVLLVVAAELVVDPAFVAPKPQVVAGLGDVFPIVVVIYGLPEVVLGDLAVLAHVGREPVILADLIGMARVEGSMNAAHFLSLRLRPRRSLTIAGKPVREGTVLGADT
jgi:hypothetical protein